MTARTPSANPQHSKSDEADNAKQDSATVKAADETAGPDRGLYVIVAQQREGDPIVEFHGGQTAAARVAQLTYGSKQHRAQVADEGSEVPEGGGSHEINRDDIQVHRLNTTEVTDF